MSKKIIFTKLSDVEFIELVKKSKNYNEILISLKVKPSTRNYEYLKYRITNLNINITHFSNKRSIIWTQHNDEEFSDFIKNYYTFSDIMRYFNISTSNGSVKTLKERIKVLNIDTSHFKIIGKNRKRIPLDEILIENSTYTRHNLKKRLLKNGMLKNECSICGQKGEWRGKELRMIIDHINGVNNDNRLENLRMVCPNCNSQLDTHSGKNTKREKKKYYCKCGKEKFKKSKMCKSCYDLKQRRVVRPSKEQLLQEIKELGYEGTGRKYGVSGNAIRKWIK